MTLSGNRLAVWLIILLAALTWLPGLAHPGIHAWDESIHQAIARGTADTFWYPHLWVEPLYPMNVKDWFATDVALHNPPGAAWLAALLMKLIGVTPFAARFVGFLGQLASALVLFDLARRFAGTWPACLGAIAWVFLPFGWVLTHGYFFGDVVDCTLVGFVSLSIWALVRGIEDEARALRWAALSGAFIAAAFLTKYVLGLAPLGVAFVLTSARLVGVGPGLKLRHFAVLTLVAGALATPWLVYAARQWPEAFQLNVVDAIWGHVTGAAGADIGPWRRPRDGIFIELVMTEFQPLPNALTWLAAAWLLITAVKTRNAAALGLAVWLWSTWLLHSEVSAKAPAHVWNAAPAAMAGFAILWRDVWRSRVLGAMTFIAATVPWWLSWVPRLSKVRELIPPTLQSHSVPGPIEALVVMLIVGIALALLEKRVPNAFGIPGGVALTVALLMVLPEKNVSQRTAFREEALTSATRLSGLAIDPVIPKKSVLFQLFERDPGKGTIFEVQNSLFWSGRMTYRRALDLPAARAKGYHAYVVSSRAEPFTDLSEVPEHSPVRVYDAEQPADAPEVPRLARLPTPVELKNGQTVLGIARGPLDLNHDQYALYLRSDAMPGALQVVFELTNGTVLNQRIEPEASLFARESLRDAKWFILPVIGPRSRQLSALRIDEKLVPVPR